MYVYVYLYVQENSYNIYQISAKNLKLFLYTRKKITSIRYIFTKNFYHIPMNHFMPKKKFDSLFDK